MAHLKAAGEMRHRRQGTSGPHARRAGSLVDLQDIETPTARQCRPDPRSAIGMTKSQLERSFPPRSAAKRCSVPRPGRRGSSLVQCIVRSVPPGAVVGGVGDAEDPEAMVHARRPMKGRSKRRYHIQPKKTTNVR